MCGTLERRVPDYGSSETIFFILFETIKTKMKEGSVGKVQPGFMISRRTRDLLKVALEEDIGAGDITSEMLIAKGVKTGARVVSKESGIFCGAPVLSELFKLTDASLRVEFSVTEGKRFPRNKTVLVLTGNMRSILAAERTAMNLLGHLSGVATMTRKFVDAVKPYPVFILDTRKTTPLWREIEKYAVRVGGGRNHRMGLYDAVFVKENHRSHADFGKIRSYEGSFEMEVRNLEELREALKLKPRVILFDNFTPARTKAGVQMARQKSPSTILEASGGITLENAAHYAAMGVDWISVGALTRSVRSIDFSLLVD